MCLRVFLPEELLQHAFSFLSPEDLTRASRVSKEWRKIASSDTLWQAFDLTKVIPSLTIIPPTVWNTYLHLGLDASNAPPLNKRHMIPLLKELPAQVEENAGITLLTIPKKLTLKKLNIIASTHAYGKKAYGHSSCASNHYASQ